MLWFAVGIFYILYIEFPLSAVIPLLLFGCKMTVPKTASNYLSNKKTGTGHASEAVLVMQQQQPLWRLLRPASQGLFFFFWVCVWWGGGE